MVREASRAIPAEDSGNHQSNTIGAEGAVTSSGVHDDGVAGGAEGATPSPSGGVFSLVASFGMDPIDVERALGEIRGRGLVCVGRYTSVPPSASPAAAATSADNGSTASAAGATAEMTIAFSPTPEDLEAQASFQSSLDLITDLTGGTPFPSTSTAPPSLQLPLRAPCVCATLRPYQAAAGLPASIDASCPSPIWFRLAPPEGYNSSASATPVEGRGVELDNRGSFDNSGPRASVIVLPEAPSVESPAALLSRSMFSSDASAVVDTDSDVSRGLSLVSELSGLVGALVSEYGRRPGVMSFLSEPAVRCPQYDRQYDSRLQYAVASAVVLLPEDCREAFGDVVLSALAACFSQQHPAIEAVTAPPVGCVNVPDGDNVLS